MLTHTHIHIYVHIYTYAHIHKTSHVHFSMITPPPYQQYLPCFVMPTKTDILRVQDFENFLSRSKHFSTNGCARADRWEAEKKESGAKVTRILARSIAADDEDEDGETSSSNPVAPSTSVDQEDDHLINDDLYQEDLIESQRLIETTRVRYKEMAAAYLLDEHNLQVRRSKIHGWGLFARSSFSRGDLIVEYIGQKIRQVKFGIEVLLNVDFHEILYFLPTHVFY